MANASGANQRNLDQYFDVEIPPKKAELLHRLKGKTEGELLHRLKGRTPAQVERQRYEESSCTAYKPSAPV